jgi:hypothetical protein
MKRNRYEVVYDAESREWLVVAMVTITAGRKAEAVELASLLARNDAHELSDAERAELRGWLSDAATVPKPSQVVIRRKSGAFQEERTFPRSSDPRRHKG